MILRLIQFAGSPCRAVPCDIFDAVIGGMFGLSNTALSSGLSLHNSKVMADYNADIAKDLADYGLVQQKDLGKFNLSLSKQGADYAKQLYNDSITETPSLNRAGLVAAGYNPILAVNSAAGSPFSTSVGAVAGNVSQPNTSGSGSPRLNSDILGAIRDMAAIRQTEAQTDLIKRRTAGEGWTVKTLSRSEAAGLGVNVLKSLGINLSKSDADTFLVAYNPITNEFRHIGNTESGLGAAEVTNALDVPSDKVLDVPSVKVGDMIHYYADPKSDKPTSSYNLPR